MTRIYPSPRTQQLNGKVERSHRTDKDDFHQLLTHTDDVDLNRKAEAWEENDNFHGPHFSHDGRTRYEVMGSPLSVRTAGAVQATEPPVVRAEPAVAGINGMLTETDQPVRLVDPGLLVPAVPHAQVAMLNSGMERTNSIGILLSRIPGQREEKMVLRFHGIDRQVRMLKNAIQAMLRDDGIAVHR